MHSVLCTQVSSCERALQQQAKAYVHGALLPCLTFDISYAFPASASSPRSSFFGVCKGHELLLALLEPYLLVIDT